MPTIHFEIPKQSTCIRTEYLYDMDPTKKGSLTRAEIIGISSYPGHAPTFTALIDGKYLFHYLPIVAFSNTTAAVRTVQESCYFNCPDTEVAVSVLPNLSRCNVYSKDNKFIGMGTYVMTFDWYRENDLCHMIKLDNGGYVLAPSHKVVFGEQENKSELPSYRKLHATWRV